MTASGVDLKFCRRLADVNTGKGIIGVLGTNMMLGHAFIMVNSKGENIIVIVGGSNMHYEDLTKLPTEYEQAIDNCII